MGWTLWARVGSTVKQGGYCLSQSFFEHVWNWEMELLFHGECWMKLVHAGWLPGDARVHEEQPGDAEEGRLRACSMPEGVC